LLYHAKQAQYACMQFATADVTEICIEVDYIYSISYTAAYLY